MITGKRRTIAILGGAFDPPHLGHVLIVSNILNSGMADAVWFVPVGDERVDKAPVANAGDRRKMTETLIQDCFSDDSRVRLETMQLDGKLPGSYTIDLMRALRKAHPDCDFMFVIGADNVTHIKDWKDPDSLKKEVSFLVLPRLGVKVPEKLPACFIMLTHENTFESSVSSSAIRKLIAKGAMPAGVVSPGVWRFIEGQRLYRQ